MKVRFIVHSKEVAIGSIQELDNKEAVALIQSGHAVAVKARPETAVLPKAETTKRKKK